VLNIQIIQDKEDWNAILNNHFTQSNDVYFSFEYFELYSKSYDVQPEGLFWEDNNVSIFWTHLKRALNKLKNFKEMNCYDLITPYGYGGPLITIKTSNELKIRKSIKDFFDEYTKFALENMYVSEFVRFHPLLKNWIYFNDVIKTIYVNDVVFIDLNKEWDEIWTDLSKTTKRYIRKAQNEFSTVYIKEKPEEEEILSFFSLYNQTMKIQNASSKYFFDLKFIKNHFNFNNILVYCSNNENIVGASAIMLRSKNFMHYHLGSTNYEFKSSPLRAVLWHSVRWAKENGCKIFHFGGGRGENDSLYNFKKGFSNDISPFHIGKIIFNQDYYDKLNSLNPYKEEIKEYFPSYRLGFDNTIV